MVVSSSSSSTTSTRSLITGGTIEVVGVEVVVVVVVVEVEVVEATVVVGGEVDFWATGAISVVVVGAGAGGEDLSRISKVKPLNRLSSSGIVVVSISGG
jgi:hypothetical protein